MHLLKYVVCLIIITTLAGSAFAQEPAEAPTSKTAPSTPTTAAAAGPPADSTVDPLADPPVNEKPATEELPGQRGQSTSAKSPLRYIIDNTEAGIVTGLNAPVFSGPQTVESGGAGFIIPGYSFHYRIFEKQADRLPVDLWAYTNLQITFIDYSFKSQVGTHTVSADEQYYQFGFKGSLGGYRVKMPNALDFAGESRLWPFVKLAFSTKVNSKGRITYPGGPRSFAVASLAQNYGLALGLGSELRTEMVTFALEFNYQLFFNPYQAERYYSFYAIREEFTNFDVQDLVEDVKSDEIGLSSWQILFAVRYRLRSIPASTLR